LGESWLVREQRARRVHINRCERDGVRGGGNSVPAFENGQHYQKQKFMGVTAAGETFTGIEFEGCMFERALLSGCTFHRCRFSESRFTGCDLSLLKVPNCRFTSVQFSGSKLIGVDWTAAPDTDAARVLLSLGFDRCVLDYANLSGLLLRETKLTRCSLKEANLSETDLTGTDCRESDFEAAVFLHTVIERADFRGARNYAIDLTANRVKGAKFSLPEAVALLNSFEIAVEY
jgi:fluoroquinolone resistance protein